MTCQLTANTSTFRWRYWTENQRSENWAVQNPLWGTGSNVLAQFGGQTSCFPCKYLGLPLQIGRTRRADEQILIDKIGARLPGWKGRLLNKSGRLQLVQSVLSSIPTYYVTVFSISKWAVKKIDRIQRNFLWKGSENARGGHCLVNWRRVCRA
jgi:mannosylglycoprotein endo-beta-mannosidase